MRRGWCLPMSVLALLPACSGGGGGSLVAFCATAERFGTDNPASAFDAYDPADPAAAAGLLRTAGQRLHAWAAEAPSAIDEDVEDIADAADALANEFEAPGAAPSDDLNQQLEAVEAASGRVVEFTREQCQVDLEPTSTTATSVAPAD